MTFLPRFIRSWLCWWLGHEGQVGCYTEKIHNDEGLGISVSKRIYYQLSFCRWCMTNIQDTKIITKEDYDRVAE